MLTILTHLSDAEYSKQFWTLTGATFFFFWQSSQSFSLIQESHSMCELSGGLWHKRLESDHLNQYETVSCIMPSKEIFSHSPATHNESLKWETNIFTNHLNRKELLWLNSKFATKWRQKKKKTNTKEIKQLCIWESLENTNQGWKV